EDGIRLYQVYNSGYPTVYGNLIHIGAGGHNQLVYSWSGDNRIYHRSRRDISNDWTDFSTVAFLNDNVASATQLKNPRKINNVAFDGTTDITIKDDTKVPLDPMPANQGAYMAWNKSLGQGRTDIVNHKGFGKGGFEFWNGKDNDFKSIAIIDENGNYLGNSSTATKLQNPRKINGEVFDGSADINIQKIVSSGDLPLIKSGGGDGGIRLYQVYNNGYPTPYGNVIHIGGSGRNQILCSWGGDNRLYHRSKTDVRNDWTDFSTIAFTTDNVASATKLQTARKLNSVAFDGTSDITLPIGFLGDVNDMTGVDWKAPSGIYRAIIPGVDSRVVAHFSVPGGSTPAMQLAGIYGNGGLFFRSAVDDKGFTKPFERVVTENGGIAKTTQRLQNPRKINGESFDGTADITIKDDTKVALDPMPANQGAYMAWNKVGGAGRTDFVNHQGLGKGGFDFWNGKDGNFSKIASIDENGNYSKNAASATKLENQRNISVSGVVSGSAYFDGTSDITINTTAVESNLRIVTGNNYTITYDDYRRIAVIEMVLWTNESVSNQGTIDRYANDRILMYSLPITLKKRLNANVILHETGTTTPYYNESREWLINPMFDGYRNNDTQTKLCVRLTRWTGSSDEAVSAHATIVGIF
ncbi:hypothetical protein I2F30_08970, partial [Acinetobacter sp. SCC474]|nr:hypothetical protein [Acinetobacter pollinis]